MNDRDPEFATKAVAIIELLLSPPTDGPLFCVDEKPGIGVREPTAPDQPPVPRQRPATPRPARREFEYVRHGTVDLLAGFTSMMARCVAWSASSTARGSSANCSPYSTNRRQWASRST